MKDFVGGSGVIKHHSRVLRVFTQMGGLNIGGRIGNNYSIVKCIYSCLCVPGNKDFCNVSASVTVGGDKTPVKYEDALLTPRKECV